MKYIEQWLAANAPRILNESLEDYKYGMSFLPLAEVLWWVEDHKQDETEPVPLKKAATAVNPQNILNPLWLKLGFDGSHTWLMVDLDPSKLGTYGQVIFVDEEYETAFLVANSVRGLLATFAQDLKMGLYQLNCDAALDSNDFLEADARIDLINWYNAERWQHAAEQ